MQSKQIENTVVDEANHRTYVVLAPRVLSDGEIYKAIRQEILKRGGVPPSPGETLTINLTPGEPPTTPSPDSPRREHRSPLLVTGQGAGRPHPMTNPAPADPTSGEST